MMGPMDRITMTKRMPGTSKFQSPAYAAPGKAMKVRLVMMVASSESPAAQPGTVRPAMK